MLVLSRIPEKSVFSERIPGPLSPACVANSTALGYVWPFLQAPVVFGLGVCFALASRMKEALLCPFQTETGRTVRGLTTVLSLFHNSSMFPVGPALPLYPGMKAILVQSRSQATGNM